MTALSAGNTAVDELLKMGLQAAEIKMISSPPVRDAAEECFRAFDALKKGETDSDTCINFTQDFIDSAGKELQGTTIEARTD